MSRVNVRAFARLFLCSTALVSLALAETAEETIVVTGSKATGGEFGSKSGIPLDKLPQSVQVITASDLSDRGVTSIGEALRGVPSANIGTPRVSPYQSFSLKVRGFLADQMRNGVRQRYYEDVDASAISNIGRIEVLKGPSAVLFGESAVGGIISIVTKRPEREFGWGGSATAGSYDRYVGSFDITGTISEEARLYGRVTGEIERAGTFVDFQDIDRENAAISLTWSPSESVTAYLVTEWQEKRTLRNPGLPIVGTLVSNGIAEIDKSTFLGEPDHSDLKTYAPLIQTWVDVGLGSGWTLTPRLSHSEFNTIFTQIRVLGTQADNRTVNRNGRFGHEDDGYTIGQLDLSGSFETAGIRHNLLTGVEYSRERSTFLQRNIVGVPTIDALNPVYAYTTTDPNFVFSFDAAFNIDAVAGYVQDVIDVTENWNVVAGARYSNIRSFNSFNGFEDDSRVEAWTWQLGSTLKLGGGVSLYGGYNTGFDIESTAGSFSRTGEPFGPQESNQAELGVRYQGEGLRLSAAVFQIERQNVLTADPVDPDFSVQTGEIRVRGIELEGSWEAMPGLFVDGGYAWLDGKVTRSNNGDEGGAIGDLPEHTATLFARWRAEGSPLELRGGVNYVSSRALVNASAVELPGYTTVDLGASWDFEAVKLAVNVSNVFDEGYYTASGNALAVYPGDPRQVAVTLSRSF